MDEKLPIEDGVTQLRSQPQSRAWVSTGKDVLNEKNGSDHDIPQIDRDLERKAVWKLDLVLMPIMTMFYFLSFLDRANIGNARVAGLQSDLRLTDNQYQTVVTVLYVPYICAELPSNLLLRKIGPNILMPTILIIWGTIVTLQGTVKSYAGLVAVRFFLGLVEGPMFPGIVLYLSGFYTRKELSLRIAIFFSAASLSGAFSGLLAAAIENMNGLKGKAGWQWIFILEGIFSILVGLISFFLVPATPQDVLSLTQVQKDLINLRLARDRPTTAPLDSFSFSQVLQSLTSPHVIIMFVILFLDGTILYGLALFLPTIVNELGFSKTRTQLISVGPYAAGFAVTLATAYISDRYRNRMVMVTVIAAFAVVGFAMFLGAHRSSVAYGSLFLSVPGAYALPPILSAWMANNSEPHYRRATSIALGFVATNAGGILSTWSYPTKQGPRYVRASIMNVTFSVLIIVFSLINTLYLSRQNRIKAVNKARLLSPYESSDYASEIDNPKTRSDLQVDEERAWVELGDRHPDFKYVL